MARFQNGWVKSFRTLYHSHYDGWDMAILGWLISAANYADGKSLVAGRGGRILLKRGQLVTSLNEIQNATKFSKSVINRRLKRYTEENIIETQTKQSGTVITILNYDKYQCIENEQETQTKQKENTSGNTSGYTSGVHIKELKKLRTKEFKEGEEGAFASDAISPDVDKFLNAYFLCIEKVYGRKPRKTSKLIDLASQIIAEVGVDRSIALVGPFCDSKREYYIKRCHHLDVMLQDLSIIDMVV